MKYVLPVFPLIFVFRGGYSGGYGFFQALKKGLYSESKPLILLVVAGIEFEPMTFGPTAPMFIAIADRQAADTQFEAGIMSLPGKIAAQRFN